MTEEKSATRPCVMPTPDTPSFVMRGLDPRISRSTRLRRSLGQITGYEPGDDGVTRARRMRQRRALPRIRRMRGKTKCRIRLFAYFLVIFQ
jgi:hypothetical protein